MEDKIVLKFKTKNILNFYEIEPWMRRLNSWISEFYTPFFSPNNLYVIHIMCNILLSNICISPGLDVHVYTG